MAVSKQGAKLPVLLRREGDFDHMDAIENKDTDNRVFIPVSLSKRRRLVIMVLNALPGVLLAVSVFDKQPGTVGALLLGIGCFAAGIGVVYFSVREYRHPGENRMFGADALAVFSGLLLIAQGSQTYDALKGFQPAHLLFLAALLYIFKGVMFPESGIKRGFSITNREMSFRKSVFRAYGPYALDKMETVSLQGNTVVIGMLNGDRVEISLAGLDQPDRIYDRLKPELDHQLTASPAGSRSSWNTDAAERH